MNDPKFLLTDVGIIKRMTIKDREVYPDHMIVKHFERLVLKLEFVSSGYAPEITNEFI